MSKDVDYEQWAVALCGLLDEIEQALNHDEFSQANILVRKRFKIAEKHGFEVRYTPIPSDVQDLRRDH